MSQGNIRVLFVDDEPNVLAGLRRMLHGKRREWDMTFAGSGEAALAAMREQPYDVVVSDMRMPGMNGAELLGAIREDWPDTIRLVLSGQSDQELTLRAVGPAHQYLTKPCDPHLLEKTIERACAAHDDARSKAVRRAVAKLTSLPSLPDAYAELIAEMNSPQASIESAGRIISQDLGMSSKILQLINSSFFGLPVHVTDVEHATALLGLNIIRPLVLSANVFRQFEEASLGKLSLSGLVDHSLCVAMMARRIAVAESAPVEFVDNALLAGLMHDVGQIMLAENFTEDYDATIELAATTGQPLAQLEQEMFGFTHADIGGHLLSLWGLPGDIVNAVSYHHDPQRSLGEEFDTLTTIHVAEVGVDAENEGVPEHETLDSDYLHRVGKFDRIEVWQAEWDDPAANLTNA